MDEMEQFLKRLAKKSKTKAIPVPASFLSLLENVTKANGQKFEVGKVSPELLKQFRNWEKRSDQFDDDIEVFTKQKELEAEREAEERFGERRDALNDEKDKMWDDIADYLGVSRETRLSINIRNGMVSSHRSDDEDDDDGDDDDTTTPFPNH